MQQCRKCGIDKPLDSFAKNKLMKSGYIKTCKSCQISNKESWIEANQERLKEYRKVYYSKKTPAVVPFGIKTCTVCKQDKQISEFGKFKNAYDGLRHQCKRCVSDYNRKKRESDPESKRKRSADYYRKNVEAFKLYNKKYSALNKGRMKQYQRMYRPLYALRNLEKLATKTRNYRARKRMAEGSHTSIDIQNLLINKEGRCKVCYVDVSKGYHVDHIVALVNGGSNWPSNLQILCPTCNTSKGAKDFEEWLKDQEVLN